MDWLFWRKPKPKRDLRQIIWVTLRNRSHVVDYKDRLDEVVDEIMAIIPENLSDDDLVDWLEVTIKNKEEKSKT